MKRDRYTSEKSLRLTTASLILAMSFTSEAALLSRAGGSMYYDTVLDITWLADANYAYTSGYVAEGVEATSGKMNWNAAVQWADQLVFGNYDDWRLPTALPVNGVDYVNDLSYDGSTDVGYNITSPNNELAYMFAVNLGNLSYYDVNGNGPQDGSGLVNTGPFTGLHNYYYWTGTALPGVANYSYGFSNIVGGQRMYYQPSLHYAWAVRDGDVATVPIPAAIWLFGSGLLFIRMLNGKRSRITQNTE